MTIKEKPKLLAQIKKANDQRIKERKKMQKTMKITVHLNPEADDDIIAYIEEGWDTGKILGQTNLPGGKQMKIKVKTLLERRENIRKLMRTVQDYGGKITDGCFKMPEGMDDEITEALAEYVDLMNALLDSAEVTF